MLCLSHCRRRTVHYLLGDVLSAEVGVVTSVERVVKSDDDVTAEDAEDNGDVIIDSAVVEKVSLWVVAQ